jgi:tetratricopeptide (TPR) repeat protein
MKKIYFFALLVGLSASVMANEPKDESLVFYAKHNKTTGLPPAMNKIIAEGIGFMGKKQWDQAIAAFNRVLEQHPKSAAALGNRGVCFLSAGDLDRAIADATKAIRLDPRTADSAQAVLNVCQGR